MRFPKWMATGLFLSCLCILCGCIAVKDSPAPGCIQYIGLSPMGGCMGKNAIVSLKVEGAADCIQMKVNNCNGGVLEVQNTCVDELFLGGTEILQGELVSLDVIENGGGDFGLVRNSSNFSTFLPEIDTPVKINGDLGGQVINVTFTKTAPLCE